MDNSTKTEAMATHKIARISAYKARLVADLIRNKPAIEARNILKNTNKKAAKLIEKVLNSAIANAENNLELKSEDLYVTKIYVNDGPVMKRMKPGSRGYIDRHDKRTSHITVVVGQK